MPRRLIETDDAVPVAGDEGWPEGLVAVGGALDADTLVRAYRAGVFPWSSDPAVTWWCPDPRAIFDLETWAPARSLRKSIRHAGWRFAVDEDFAGVMRRCAEPTPARPSTWITGDFVASYCELHRTGLAHSVEVYEGAEMVGGLYGIAIGGFFGGESMFHRRTDASKAALAHLIERLRAGGFTLLDAQAPNPHLANIGAQLIPRGEYLRRLEQALTVRAKF
jgi:leucyl/phenylalanyl-tRNA--protein transferase